MIPISPNISKVEWYRKSGALQHFLLRRQSQQVPASLAITLIPKWVFFTNDMGASQTWVPGQCSESVLQPFQDGFSVPCSSVVPLDLILIGFTFWGAFLVVQDSRLGCLMWGTNSLLFREKLHIFRIPPIVGHHSFLLLFLISVWLFILCCGGAVHLVFNTSSGETLPYVAVVL